MEAPAAEVKNLVKNFNGFLAVDNISFAVQRGEIIGLLGPNGAGKTTTIMMMLGIISPTAGSIEILGMGLQKNKGAILRRINFSSAYNLLPGRLSVLENLYVFSRFYQIKNPEAKIKTLLEEFEIFNLRNNLVQSLSSGQLTRVGICKALLNEPEILFLDEPTASLDPDIAKKVRDYLLEIKRKRNISMLYTSHNMEEITRMCDRVIFLDKGKIVTSGTPLGLTKMIKDCFLSLTFDAELKRVKEFAEKRNLNFQIPQPNVLEVTLQEQEIALILTELAKNSILITDIKIEKPDLEDVFLKIASGKQSKP